MTGSEARGINHVSLDAQIVERGPMRYTPAGLPALDLSLKHESTVDEAGMPRKVALELKALGIGLVTKQLESLAVATTARFTGFLGAARNGRGVVLHITEVEIAPVRAPSPHSPSSQGDHHAPAPW